MCCYYKEYIVKFNKIYYNFNSRGEYKYMNENIKNQKTFLIILGIATIVVALIGATFAYWSWETASGQRTAVSFTVGNGFSCSADGGGNITSSDVQLMPTTCDDLDHAIKRTVKVNTTQNAGKKVYLDMNLKVNDIGTGLAGTTNFKYALTTGSDSCTDGVVKTGNFSGATTNTEKPLLSNKEYASTTSNDTYYLWIWLDAAETNNNTQNQTFNISLSGSCTDEEPSIATVYTANLSDENVTNNNSVVIGSPIPSAITQYNTSAAAISSLEAAYASANSGATASLPFYLKHTVGNGSLWCASGTDGYSYCIYSTETECNANVSWRNYDDVTFSCVNNTVTNGVIESYVGFEVSSTMATANPGMTAGTYYLKGGDNGASFEENEATLLSAFGSTYCTANSSGFSCNVSGLYAYASPYGGVCAGDASDWSWSGSRCEVDAGGNSNCVVDDGQS